jgi:hypothetical protein
VDLVSRETPQSDGKAQVDGLLWADFMTVKHQIHCEKVKIDESVESAKNLFGFGERRSRKTFDSVTILIPRNPMKMFRAWRILHGALLGDLLRSPDSDHKISNNEQKLPSNNEVRRLEIFAAFDNIKI